MNGNDDAAKTIAYVLNKENLVDADIELFREAAENMRPEDIGPLLLQFSGKLPEQLASFAKSFMETNAESFDLGAMVYGFNKVNAHTLMGKVAGRALKYAKTDAGRGEVITALGGVLPGMEYALANKFGMLGVTRQPVSSNLPYTGVSSYNGGPYTGEPSAYKDGNARTGGDNPYGSSAKTAGSPYTAELSGYSSEKHPYTSEATQTPDAAANDSGIVVPAVPELGNVRRTLEALNNI